MNNKAILIAAAMLGSLSGCAVIPDKIDLAYQPQQGVVEMPKASQVMVAVKVTDERQDKSRVGSKTNGYGAELAAIQTNEDVTVTVQHAIEQELHARGFQSGTNATVNIDVDMTKFYNKFDVGFSSATPISDLNMRLVVKAKAGSVLYVKELETHVVMEKRAMLTGGNNARIALDKAFSNAMQTLFDDKAFIAALMASTTPN